MICEITFSTAIYVQGKDIQEIRQKFENMPLYHPDIENDCEFNDIEQVIRVDNDLYEEFTHEYNCAYDQRQDSPDVL